MNTMKNITHQISNTSLISKGIRWLRFVPPIMIVLLVLLAWIVYLNPNFTNPPVFLSFLRRASPLLILAAGQLFVIVAGGFDLSVGSLITLTVLGSAILVDNDPSRTGWVIGVMYLIGIVVGLLNAFIVNVLRVSSFIGTLGMLLALDGLALFWSGGTPAGYLPDNFRIFGRGFFEGIPVIDRFPYAVMVLIVFATIAVFVYHGTNFGKQIKAIGDNAKAARLSGIRVSLVRTLAFVISALSAVTAGILLGGFAGVSTDVGDGYELEAISAVVLGGAALLGGRGSVITALAGALTLRALFTLLNLLGLSAPVRFAVQGLILIGAAAYAAYSMRRPRQFED
jgi:ribose transport system permease protein